MNHGRKIGYHLGVTEEGKFIAASVSTPFFCFEGETDKEVSEKAERAIRFFFSGAGVAFDAPISRTKQIVSFVPQRRVEVELEAA